VNMQFQATAMQTLTSESSLVWSPELPVRRYHHAPLTASEALSFLVAWFKQTWKTRVGLKAYAVAKRGLDIAASATGLLLLSPLFLAVAAAIKISDSGPVLFWQKRVGLSGKVFAFPKFRSMVTNAEAMKKELLAQNQHGEGVTFKMKRDPRITAVGRFIRRFSIDELPQLWCVLNGDMSLVGPRPALTQEVEKYTLRDRVRLQAHPGLTCIWQVSGRSDIPFEQQVKLDEQYILRQSFWLDIRILFQTIPAVLTGKGAY